MSTPVNTPENKSTTSRMTLTRRGFIAAGGLAAGGLVLGVFGSESQPRSADSASATTASGSVGVLTWIEIRSDNQITALVPHCEMGQGALTGLGMMLAEELEAD